MNIPVLIGMDTSKSVFQLHGVDENEVMVVRRQLPASVFRRPPANLLGSCRRTRCLTASYTTLRDTIKPQGAEISGPLTCGPAEHEDGN